MKKEYIKPELEQIAFESEETIADEVSLGTGTSPFSVE